MRRGEPGIDVVRPGRRITDQNRDDASFIEGLDIVLRMRRGGKPDRSCGKQQRSADASNYAACEDASVRHSNPPVAASFFLIMVQSVADEKLRCARCDRVKG